ncbi:hypothetical protein N5D79_08680 [Pseudomonas sp. GD03817]|uniref:hypothetical protein n=1 Tax=unclassified Pseudomonas TaxID=196821 RepID=UPI002447D597|nr:MULTISPECIES: hypothetical protein [unclassified Pseudomonas]MDH1401288.1 hypothetical protein [Pseudomonas sp. GD03730]MDH1774952.1 hypothetical protein [Pseudomonas sp. GD03817]
MPNPTRIWQLISLVLFVLLFAALIELYRSSTARCPVTDPLRTVDNSQNYERLALSPNARLAHERYSL